MMQKDYLLRIASELGGILARIFHLQEIKDYNGAFTLIDDILKQALGFNSHFLNSVSDDMLLALLTSFNVLDIEKCLLVATLLKAEGDIYVDQGDFDTSYYSYLKALHLSLAVLLSDSNIHDPELFSQIEELLRKLEEYELPAETHNKLLHYYDRRALDK